MATAALFNAGDLKNWLNLSHAPKNEVASLRERIVWGWLKVRLKLDERPDPVPEEIFAWAVELGAIVHENPAAFTGKTLGDDDTTFSSERITQILNEVEAYAAGDTGDVPAPRGSFPPPTRYPDPACPPFGARYYTR